MNLGDDKKLELELGIQPLDGIMIRLGIQNADLVQASADQLSFKAVQKARKGRRLTLHLQKKILNALCAAKPGTAWTLRDLFSY